MANNSATFWIVFDRLARPTSRVINGALTKNWKDAEQELDKLDGALKTSTFKGRIFQRFQPRELPIGAWRSILVKLAWEPHDSVYELLHKVASGDYTEFLDGAHNDDIIHALQTWNLNAYYDVISGINMQDNEAKVNGFSGQEFDWLAPDDFGDNMAAINATIPQVPQLTTLYIPVLLHSLGILYGILRYLKEKIEWPARTKKKRVPFAQSAYDRLFDVQLLLRDRAASLPDVPDDNDDVPNMPIAILFLLVAFFVFALTQ